MINELFGFDKFPSDQLTLFLITLHLLSEISVFILELSFKSVLRSDGD